MNFFHNPSKKRFVEGVVEGVVGHIRIGNKLLAGYIQRVLKDISPISIFFLILPAYAKNFAKNLTFVSSISLVFYLRKRQVLSREEIWKIYAPTYVATLARCFLYSGYPGVFLVLWLGVLFCFCKDIRAHKL